MTALLFILGALVAGYQDVLNILSKIEEDLMRIFNDDYNQNSQIIILPNGKPSSNLERKTFEKGDNKNITTMLVHVVLVFYCQFQTKLTP